MRILSDLLRILVIRVFPYLMVFSHIPCDIDNALPFKNDEKAVSDLSSAPIEHVNSADVAPKTLMAAEGFLAVCGGCRVKMHIHFYVLG